MARGDGVRLALFHAPTGMDAVQRDVDLPLAGHTHGGQVHLPLLGALWRQPGSGTFDRGWYRRERAWMHVSQGLGTSILRVRLRDRLRLRTKSGNEEIFVVSDLESTIKRIQLCLPK